MKLTENFTLEEFYISSTANRLDINNTPNGETKDNIIKLAQQLQIIRDEYKKPIIISSGYRCWELNKRVGGASNSDHLYGCAVDIHSKSDTIKDNKELFNTILKLIKNNKLSLRQIIDEYNFNWVHISINNKHNSHKDNQVLHIN